MFRNRELSVKVSPVKTVDTDTPVVPERRIELNWVDIVDSTKKIIWTGAATVFVYVLLDTRRQVKVEEAKNPR